MDGQGDAGPRADSEPVPWGLLGWVGSQRRPPLGPGLCEAGVVAVLAGEAVAREKGCNAALGPVSSFHGQGPCVKFLQIYELLVKLGLY